MDFELHLSIVLRAVLKCKSSAVYEKAIMAKLEIVKILLFQQKQHKNERELLYISRTTIINFISLICLIKYEFEKVLICQRFNYFWRHVIAVFVYVFHSAT